MPSLGQIIIPWPRSRFPCWSAGLTNHNPTLHLLPWVDQGWRPLVAVQANGLSFDKWLSADHTLSASHFTHSMTFNSHKVPMK